MSQESTPAPKSLSVTSIIVLCGCSDGTTRSAILDARQGMKLFSLMKHKVMGGRLKLTKEKVAGIAMEAPEKSASGIIIP